MHHEQNLHTWLAVHELDVLHGIGGHGVFAGFGADYLLLG